jgi:hypothetical protein
LIGCRRNGNTFSSWVEDELIRERDDFAPFSSQKSVPQRLKPSSAGYLRPD